MGCDIHIEVEVKLDDRRWLWYPGPFLNAGFDPYQMSQRRYEDRYYLPWKEKLYEGRNYDVFAALANVRNYSAVEPIAPARGLPLDRDPALGTGPENTARRGARDPYYDWVNAMRGVPVEDLKVPPRSLCPDLGEHSFSYLTLRELEAYDWSREEITDFRDQALANLRALAKEQGLTSDQVRIVFGFDS